MNSIFFNNTYAAKQLASQLKVRYALDYVEKERLRLREQAHY